MMDETANDEELARALSEQFQAEDEARRQRQEAQAVANSRQHEIPVVIGTVIEEDHSIPLPITTNNTTAASAVINPQIRIADELRLSEAFGFDNDTHTNISPEEIARRAEQEEQDARLAAHLSQQQQEDANNNIHNGQHHNIDPIDAQAMQQRQRDIQRRRSMKSALSCIFCVGICVVMFMFINRESEQFGLGDDGILPPGNPFDWFNGDNWDWEGGHGGTTQGVNTPWKTKGNNGLNTLRVLNNLDEGWQETFHQVMVEWDNGEPDAVSFIVERVNDPECKAVENTMIVCNDDYGNTNWRGINEFVTQNGWIIQSVAKLNDRFLARADNDLRQYVCCHEIGHGLGLGHTDESVYNSDLGECMDYTVNPDKNKLPGVTNFEALENMYGTEEEDGTSNGLRRRQQRINQRAAEEPIHKLIDSIGDDDNKDWELIHKSKWAEQYERDLGDGKKAHRHYSLHET